MYVCVCVSQVLQNNESCKVIWDRDPDAKEVLQPSFSALALPSLLSFARSLARARAPLSLSRARAFSLVRSLSRALSRSLSLARARASLVIPAPSLIMRRGAVQHVYRTGGMYRFELALYVAEMEEQLKQTAAFLEKNEWEQVSLRSEREAQAASVSAAHEDVGDPRRSAQRRLLDAHAFAVANKPNQASVIATDKKQVPKQKQPRRESVAMATGRERAGRTLTSASASCAAEAATAAAAGMCACMRTRTYAHRHVHATLQSGETGQGVVFHPHHANH